MKKEDQLRGVNLGGWLIPEKWMAPTLFEGLSARDLFELSSTEEGKRRLAHHFEHFITEADFRWLHEHGVNAVRIPVGYWVLDGDGFYQSTIRQLDWAVMMAKKYHLKVLIDLHGAKGSQNGRDHSGKIGQALWYKHPSYREETIRVLEQIAKRYYDHPHVWGIELLNEPKWGLFQFKLRRFYHQAYARLVAVARPGTHIVFSDGFTPRLLSGAIKQLPDFPVVMDVHWYQFADPLQKVRHLSGYFKKVGRKARVWRQLSKTQPIIIGEWSAVLSSDILGDLHEAEKAAAFQQHTAIQLVAYQECLGWFYWTYKTEQPGIWHFRSMVEDGILTL